MVEKTVYFCSFVMLCRGGDNTPPTSTLYGRNDTHTCCYSLVIIVVNAEDAVQESTTRHLVTQPSIKIVDVVCNLAVGQHTSCKGRAFCFLVEVYTTCPVGSDSAQF